MCQLLRIAHFARFVYFRPGGRLFGIYLCLRASSSFPYLSWRHSPLWKYDNHNESGKYIEDINNITNSPWWLAEGNHFGVCLFVCLSVIKLQVTVFDPATQFFENMFFRTMGKNFRNFCFWRFYGLFSLFSEFFPLCLCIGHKPPHSTYKHNFWHVGSLWHRKSKKKFFFENFHFWRFEGHFWQFLTILSNFSPHVHIFWHRNIMFWKYYL